MINQFSDDSVKKAILANQWTYGQLFPEIISPGPMPREFKYKTHTFTSRFSDTVNVWNSTSYDPATNAIVQHPERGGKLWVYFAPTSDLLILSSQSGVDSTILNENSIFYSSSNGPLPYSAFDKFDYREITMNASSKRNISLTGYKKLRVTSAAICIRQVGPEKERSGVLKIGMSYKGAIESVPSINFDKFQNYFNISDIVSLNESAEIICRYRLPKHLLDTYAPFDPTTNIPYFFIYGEGISTKMSLEIEIIRHFEGIIIPEYSSFHNPTYQPIQTPFPIQNDVIRTLENEENIIQNIENPTILDKNNELRIEKIPHYRENVSNPLEPSKTSTVYKAYENVAYKVGGKINEARERYKDSVKEMLERQGKKFVLKGISKLIPARLKSKLSYVKQHVDKIYDTSISPADNLANIAGQITNNIIDATLPMTEHAFDRLFNRF